MKILVIGGNRFVGKKLVEKLLIDSHDVTIFNRGGTGPNGAKIIECDRNSYDQLTERVNFSDFDCIVDMCLFKLNQFDKIKRFIPKNTNYIFVSSGAVDYIDTNSFGDYATDKMKVEEALSETKLNYKIIRPSYIVGIGNHRPRLGYYICQLRTNSFIKIDGDGNYPINLVFADDVVNCLYKLIKDDRVTHETYNVCGDESVTINSLLELLKSELGVKEYKVLDSKDSLFPNQSFEFDNTKIKEDYDIKFIDLKQGIKKYIKEWDEI